MSSNRTGKDADQVLYHAIDTFYSSALADERLSKFFVGADFEFLRTQQLTFLKGLFSAEKAGGLTSDSLHALYGSLTCSKGLPVNHFDDLFKENFVSVLRGAELPTSLIDKMIQRLTSFIKVFEEVAGRITDEHEARLFFALDEKNSGEVLIDDLRKSLLDTGLGPWDDRLAPLFDRLDRHTSTSLSRQEFKDVFGSASMLVEKALKGSLVIPDFQGFKRIVDEIFEIVENDNGGKQARYIPPLANVNPDQFGVAIVTTDGQMYVRGDHEVDFSIQSMCKPFNYCLAIEELGSEVVHSHVGNEPSGRAFNDRDLMARFRSRSDDSTGRIMSEDVADIPYNPMTNAGAIMTASLVKSDQPFAKRLSYIRSEWAKMIGGSPADSSMSSELRKFWPRFNKEMARQENFTGFNNFALGYMLMETGKLPNCSRTIPPDSLAGLSDDFEFIQESAVADALKIYFSTCALELNAQEMAMAAATLANGGICPTTQIRALEQTTVRDCLSVTQMCGMYDGSGDFFFKIGLPAKSGVGGGVVLIVPKLMGICIFSPRLDERGNSVRGVDFSKRLVERTRLHLYDGVMTDTDRIDPKIPLARWRAQSVSEALWAASKGDVRILSRIYREQFDLESGDYDKRTPMHIASAEGHARVVGFLLQQGVKPRLDRWGGHPISDALSAGHDHVVKVFEEAGYSAESPSHPIDELNTHHDIGADYSDNLAVVDLLWSSAQNDLSGIKRLLAQGVPVHAQDYDQRTALHLAASEGSMEAIRYLVAHGHPLNVRDRWFATPLDEALRENRGDAADFLSSLRDLT